MNSPPSLFAATCRPASAQRHAQRRGRLALAAVVLIGMAVTAQADTTGRTMSQQDVVCYCHCPSAHARGGCAKMCETRKYASRWWATTCARPRRQSPAETPGATPHLPHRDHAEHAKLEVPAPVSR